MHTKFIVGIFCDSVAAAAATFAVRQTVSLPRHKSRKKYNINNMDHGQNASHGLA